MADLIEELYKELIPTENGFTCFLIINSDRHKYLKDHQIAGKLVVPTIFLFEMALEILFDFEPQKGWNDLTRIRWQETENSRFANLYEGIDGGFTFTFLSNNSMNESYKVSIASDVTNKKGKVIRKGVKICSFTVALDEHSEHDIIDDCFDKGWGKEIRYTQEEVYSLTPHPFGYSLKTRTGNYRYSKDEEILVGESSLNNLSKHYLMGNENPNFIIPLEACCAGMQHVSFYSFFAGSGGVPGNIKSARFYRQTDPSAMLQTMVSPSTLENDGSLDMKIIDVDTSELVAVFSGYAIEK